jgi:hypothetical protein
MNSTCSEARIVVRKGTAELRVEQLRIDRSTDVDQFTLLRVDPNDPKLAAPCLQQGVQIPLEPELELLNKGLRLPSVAEFRVAAEAVNCDLKASAKMLSAQVACSITFAYWTSMDDDEERSRSVATTHDALSSANERTISVSTRIRPTISRAGFFDGSSDGRNSGRSGDEGAESRPYQFN